MKTINTNFMIELSEEEARKLATALQYVCISLKNIDSENFDKEYFARRTAEAQAMKKDIVNLRNAIGGLVGISYFGE